MTCDNELSLKSLQLFQFETLEACRAYMSTNNSRVGTELHINDWIGRYI